MNQKYPVIGENAIFTCSIEVLPDIVRSGVKLEWSGPCNGSRIEYDNENVVNTNDDDRRRTKSFITSK